MKKQYYSRVCAINEKCLQKEEICGVCDFFVVGPWNEQDDIWECMREVLIIYLISNDLIDSHMGCMSSCCQYV